MSANIFSTSTSNNYTSLSITNYNVNTSKFQSELPNEVYINGLSRGDSQIIKVIYQNFFRQIANYIIKTGGREEDSQDIFQEGLSIVYEKVRKNQLLPNTNFGGFLYKICKYTWLGKWKKFKRDVQLGDELIQLFFTDENPINRDSEVLALFNEKITELDTKERKVLSLFMHGKSMKEIAKAMGYKSENYAKKKKCIIKKKLIKLIKADERFEELRQR